MLRTAAAVLLACSTAASAQSPLAKDAEALSSMVRSKAAAQWLDRADEVTTDLPERTIYIRTRPNRAITAEAYAALPEGEREGWRAYEVTPATYHATFYGSPVAYLPAVDFAGEVLRGTAEDPEPTFVGRRILDLGYGQMGQLEMLAACGAEVVGVEVDPILTLLYEDSAEPRRVENPEGEAGSVRVLECAWPNDAACRDAVGGGYDVILARNILKRGFVKPARPVAGIVPVAEGMSDEEACRAFFDALAPGGVLVIYSLGPAPDPDKPWSDITNPWPREAWEAAGFEVVRHDADVSVPARLMFVALGYGQMGDLERDLFGVCSVYRRPGGE